MFENRPPRSFKIFQMYKDALFAFSKALNDALRAGKGGVYLPAVPKRASSLSSIPVALSQSCPRLHDKRRGSFSSVTSQRTSRHTEKLQSVLTAQREAKKSHVIVTMTYLGQGRRGSGSGSFQDELKVLQQANGGENICVFKHLVTPGDQFQFVSQRHRSHPFSATFYINGIVATRLSSCCEYRYAPGFQQGRKSCFRLTWLAGGMPCHRSEFFLLEGTENKRWQRSRN
ncbi:glutamate rich 3-like [Nothobranchius furzeri]|uniref:glutamate rich 3-like n=1 Tax=Nothobranchius furzeri TaxID=105023 RepID=UPI0039049EF9